eukprot:scaffold130991_cov49-Prasinocladus_malaysianus.AAC.1
MHDADPGYTSEEIFVFVRLWSFQQPQQKHKRMRAEDVLFDTRANLFVLITPARLSHSCCTARRVVIGTTLMIVMRPSRQSHRAAASLHTFCSTADKTTDTSAIANNDQSNVNAEKPVSFVYHLSSSPFFRCC